MRTGDPRAGAAAIVAAGPQPGAAAVTAAEDPHDLDGRGGRAGGPSRTLRRVRGPLRTRGARPRARAARRGPAEGRGRPRVHRRAGPPARHLHRPPEHPHRGAAVRGPLRWRPGAPQARGPQPHRLAQDQQRPRPGPAHQADGQDPGHRRDRRRPARRGHGDGGGADGPGLHRLHGPGRHRAPGPQRRPDEDPRRRGGARRPRLGHAQGRHQRGDARLGHQRPHDPLPHRHRHRARTRSPRWSATSTPSSARRPGRRCSSSPAGCRTPSSRASAAVERDGHLPPLRRRRRRAADRGRGRRRGHRVRPARRPVRLGDARASSTGR